MCVWGGEERGRNAGIGRFAIIMIAGRKVGGLAAGAGVRVGESKVGIDYITNLIDIGTDKY